MAIWGESTNCQGWSWCGFLLSVAEFRVCVKQSADEEYHRLSCRRRQLWGGHSTR